MKSKTIRYRPSIAVGIFLVIAAMPSTADTSVADVYMLLSGEWGGSQTHTCATNPHVIAFSADRKVATFTYQKPPDRSHLPPNLPAYSLSPEDSLETTIVFNILDQGTDWLALQRQGETKLDRLAKPQTWQIRLGKDNTSYRWHLYREVAGKKSRLRGIRCIPNDKLVQKESDVVAESNLDTVLGRLIGRWEAEDSIMGRPVTYRAEGKAVLQGRFIRLELGDLSLPAHYEAIIMIGKSETQDRYVAHWLDVFGTDASRVVGSGVYDEDKLTLQFEQTDKYVINTFRFHRNYPLRADRFDLLTQSENKVTQAVSDTASYEFRKITEP